MTLALLLPRLRPHISVVTDDALIVFAGLGLAWCALVLCSVVGWRRSVGAEAQRD